MAGRMYDDKPCCTPATGNQPSFTPKMYWLRNARTKVGTATITVVPTSVELSKAEPRLTPERMPRPMPTMVSKMNARNASRSVTGQRSRMISETS